MTKREVLAGRLKARREQLGLTQEAVGRVAGLQRAQRAKATAARLEEDTG